MRKQCSIFLASLLFAAAAHAQTVFHFTSPVTQKSLQEAATIIRNSSGAVKVASQKSLRILCLALDIV